MILTNVLAKSLEVGNTGSHGVGGFEVLGDGHLMTSDIDIVEGELSEVRLRSHGVGHDDSGGVHRCEILEGVEGEKCLKIELT